MFALVHSFLSQQFACVPAEFSLLPQYDTTDCKLCSLSACKWANQALFVWTQTARQAQYVVGLEHEYTQTASSRVERKKNTNLKNSFTIEKFLGPAFLHHFFLVLIFFSEAFSWLADQFIFKNVTDSVI